jgi:exodeoxyribonuclease V gamma subunit
LRRGAVLTIFRSNRAEFLVDVLALQLRQDPPPPLEQVRVVVNTWPTSRWLGEQLALRLGGIAAHLRFPFPAGQLAAIVDAILDPEQPEGPDPWRASRLVWPLLELLPPIAAQPEGEPLRRWLQQQPAAAALEPGTWQLGRAIADAFDDYALYRPEMLAAWQAGQGLDAGGSLLPDSQQWQPVLYRALRHRLQRDPFGLRVEQAIERLRQDSSLPAGLRQRQGTVLRLFGLSSLAPLQVRLLQALSGCMTVDLYLLTPCRDLWQRCRERRRELRDALALQQPLQGEWLARAASLEARFGRLGAEFQQLLEGTGEAQLGEQRVGDLFFLPASVSEAARPGPPPLLHQLQQQLVAPDGWPQLQLQAPDPSLEFHLCPGPLRQVQIVRDRLLQLLAADPDLQPRDILVMTPQVERFAPLIASVFGDREATGVDLPWRLTDRSQQAELGLARTLLRLLRLGGERLSASGLENLLDCRPLQERFGLDAQETLRLSRELQRLGFRWGLTAQERGGDGTHSLSWVIDRLLLALVLPPSPGLALGEGEPVAPAEGRLPLELLGRWLHLLERLRYWLRRLGISRQASDWAELLRQLVDDLFGDGGAGAGELPGLLAAIEDGLAAAADATLELPATVLADVLEEALAVDAGRFGHRSGALTISALEPMRAIPHRVIVLMGLDADSYPRHRPRPGFHLISQRRLLGDADPADQDRYILLEALLSARDRLLVTWSCRDDRTGEDLPPPAPLRHWLDWLDQSLPEGAGALQVRHPASPLERANFLPQALRPPASCDRRLLQTRLQLDQGSVEPAGGLADRGPLAPIQAAAPVGGDPLHPRAAPVASAGRTDAIRAGGSGGSEPGSEPAAAGDRFADLRAWLMQPQRSWLERLGMRSREWQDRCDDLEALELDERSRASLLRRVFQEASAVNPEAPPPQEVSDWLGWQRGTGQLPAGSAGWLEARALQRRWQSLAASLAALGEGWSESVEWQGWNAPLLGRGPALLRVQCGKESASEQLGLWLELLLASAAAPASGRRLERGVLISRDKGDRFQITTTLVAPQPQAAAAELERLAELQDRWRQRCWPVPPRTGAAWLEAERHRPGSGAARAAQVWEGGGLPGERQDDAMVICFGSEWPTESLLQDPFPACARELLEPLLEARPARPARRR